MGLVLDAKIHIPGPVHEELKGPIDDKFIARFKAKEKKEKKGNQRLHISNTTTHLPRLGVTPHFYLIIFS